MNLGVVLPQTEIGPNVGDIRAYAEGVQWLGFRHLLAYDHVVGADPQQHPGWSGPYDVETTFHEPMVLYGFLAGITALELVTGILILPQRQTALVAKQAAEVDLLTSGRFRLGVGVGWNAVEYDALGIPFSTRGARLDEQVQLLRRLWTERSVTFEGRTERVRGAGLAPLPIQRPIPVWFGGRSERAYRRAGAMGDGWFPMVSPGDELDAAIAAVRRAAEDAGRDPATIGMEARVNWSDGGLGSTLDAIGDWERVGATHVSINTMKSGLRSIDEHLDVLDQVATALGLHTSA